MSETTDGRSTAAPEASPRSTATAPTPRRRRGAVVRALRPRQWTKNVLVLVVPTAAGTLLLPEVLAPTLLAAAVFCAAASAVYLVNDVRDAPQDRCHPVKRFRPVAAGELSPGVAVAVSLVLASVALLVAFWWTPSLGVVVVAYLVTQGAYTFGLKHQAVLDMAIVSSGFVLRVIAGAVATGIAVSGSLMLVASFGSLFMVAGKRFSELRRVGDAAGTRPALRMYSESYLRFVWSLAAAVTVVTYVQWSFAHAGARPGDISWGVISVAPFVLAMLRYAVDIDRGTAGAPEDLVLGDRVLQLLCLLWLVAVVPALVAA